jgi:uncharacterized protein YrrD
MQFKQGASVVTAQQQAVGRIERVVIDPRSKDVTHIVVRKGRLSAQHKVVPIHLIAATTEAFITLRGEAGDLQSLPDFEEAHYIAAGENSASPDQPPGYGSALHGSVPIQGSPIDYLAERPRLARIVQVSQNIPERTVALKQGASVISADDRRVGHVEQVLVDPQADLATHLSISTGLLLKETRIIPVQWVTLISENEVHLAIRSRLLDELGACR